MGKKYNVQYGVGKSKYVVNFQEGVKKHKDGSNFYDIQTFRNKKKMELFTKKLSKEGYTKEY